MEKSSILGTIIGIGEMKITSDQTEILTAPNLGSCLGVSIYDPSIKVGGMIHCLLPLSTKNPEKAKEKPGTYVDTGIPLLLEEILKRGGQKKNLVICVAGGASMNSTNDMFEIGQKNYSILRKILWKNNLLIKKEDVGSNTPRSISLYCETGEVWLKVNGERLQMT